LNDSGVVGFATTRASRPASSVPSSLIEQPAAVLLRLQASLQLVRQAR
jgi:hypothetical protein